MSEGLEPVVIDTGPLIALSACRQLDLLPLLHGRVIVPLDVIDELQRGQAPGHVEVIQPEWLEINTLVQPISPLLLAHLDIGEAAVIALALEMGIIRVLMDERRGRLVARTMGISVSGSLGVLLKAKHNGHLTAIRPCIESMIRKGVWISARLADFALREADEL